LKLYKEKGRRRRRRRKKESKWIIT